MKKCVVVFVMLALVFSLTACGAQPEMTLKPAELTDQEKDLKQLIGSGGEPYLYDFTVDQTIQSVHFRFYRLGKDGKWESLSASRKPVSNSGRLAVAYDNESNVKFTAVQSGKDFAQFTLTGKYTEAKDNLSYSAEPLSEEVKITSEKEIPIFISLGASKSEFETYGMDGYFKPEKYKGYEQARAVTVTFSEKSMEE